jgi:hypothetical protein
MKQREVAPGMNLGPVLERFPEHEESIRELARRDRQFGELCGDYEECVAALQRFRARGGEALGPVEEYTEFRVGLEHELLAAIVAFLNARTMPEKRSP